MNPKRLLLAIVAAFVTVFATDFLIHGLWMMPVYHATASLWRTDAEMQSHMGWLSAGQLLAAVTFVMIYAKGFAPIGCMKCAVIYGTMMGLFGQVSTLISYAVQPFTLEIVWKWFVSGVAQGAILGAVTFLAYKPAAK